MRTYENEIMSAISKLADAAFERVLEICPVKTGRLKRSLTLKKTPYTALISTDVPYAAAVEFGYGRNIPRHYMGAGASRAADCAAEIFASELFGERSGNA